MSDVIDLATADAGEVATGSRWGWAAYLGASWTWCIGMFLPVLLIRDYGPWAWVIFAVPNVVGAAAMGWVMRSQAMSRQYTADHASACRLFSYVTIAFQLFFAVWMLPRLVGPAGYVGAGAIVMASFLTTTRSRWLRIGGFIALIISAGLAFLLYQNGALVWPRPQGVPRFDAGSVAGLTLVCLAGFLTCPYLDLTFQRARIETTPTGAKVAFGMGFGVLFGSMIVLTFFYAPLVNYLMNTIDGQSERPAAMLLAIHLLVQMTYTASAHAAELVRQSKSPKECGLMRVGLGAWLALALVIGLGVTLAADKSFVSHGRSLGEAGYRCFMSAYGLLFPAYVLLAIRRSRVSTAAWLLITFAAMPFYWLAFIEARMAWATVGVAVMVLGVLIARAVTRPASASPTG